MKLRRLRIDRLPGIRDGYEVSDLSPGLNVIHGPNGVGKSSIGRAIRGLLWAPPRGEARRYVCEAEWERGDGRAISEVAGSNVHWLDASSRRGAEPPSVPDEAFASCFVVRIEDLLASDDGHAFAAEIHRRLSAGLDFEALRSGVFRPGARPGGTERRNVNAARETLREARVDASRLDERGRSLESIERRRRKAAAAERRVEVLRKIRDLRDVQRSLDAAESEVAAFPAAMHRIQGDETDRLKDWRTQIDELKQRELTLRNDRRSLQSQIDAAAALEADPVRLRTSRAHIRELNRLESQVGEIKSRSDAFEHALEKQRLRMGMLDPADGPVWSAEAMRDWCTRLQDVAARSDDLEHRLSRNAELLARLESVQPESDVDLNALRESATLLRSWLRTPEASDLWRERAVMWIVTLLVAAAGAVLWGVGRTWGIWLIAAGIVFVAAGVLDTLLAAGRRRRDLMRIERELFGAEPRPDRSAVRDALSRVEKAIGQGERDEIFRSDAAAGRARERELMEEQARVEQERAELAAAMGVTFGRGEEAGVLAWLNEWIRLRDLDADVVKATGEYDAVRERVEQLAARLAGSLASVGVQEASDAATLESAVEDAIVRIERANEAATRIEHIDRELATIESSLEERRTRVHALFERLGLDDNDDRSLAVLLTRRRLFRSAVEECDNLRAVRDRKRIEAGDVEPFSDLDDEALAREISDAESLANEHDELLEEETRIRRDLETAARDCRVASAIAEVEAAETTLERARTDHLDRVAACFLLSRAEQAYTQERRPEVVREASRLFSAFTHRRYELGAPETVDGRPHLTALDRVADERVEVGALSTGSRVQLLLAVRLAFAAVLERGETLPIVLDESLSSSDPERFDAAVRALLTLAQMGRQIFYMTCQPGDVERIRAIAEDEGVEPPKVIDLLEVRRIARQASGRAVDPLARATATRIEAEVPSLAGRSEDEIRELLEAPPLDLRRPTSTAHAVHLLADRPDLLERLLRLGVRTVGQVAAFADEAPSDAFADAEREFVRVRLAAFEAFARAWAVGRGRPVEREIIESENGVSRTFEDKVWSLSCRMNHDGLRIVEALRDRQIKNFRNEAISTFEQALEEAGCIDRRERLTEPDIRLAVLKRLSGAFEVKAVDNESVQAFIDSIFDRLAGSEADSGADSLAADLK